MSVAHVQSTGFAALGAGAKQVTLGSSVTAGNLLVLFVTWSSAVSLDTVSDDVNGSWTIIPGSLADGGNGWQTQAAVKPNVAGGTTTITATFTGGGTGNAIMEALEYSGAATSSPVDASASAAQTGGGGTTPSCAITTVTDHAAIVATSMASSNATVGSGYTQRLNTSDILTQDKLDQTPQGGTTVPFGTSSTWWQVSAVALKPVGVVLPPVNTVAPAVTGTPQVGQILTVSPGTWDPGADSYTYQWQRRS